MKQHQESLRSSPVTLAQWHTESLESPSRVGSGRDSLPIALNLTDFWKMSGKYRVY
ncbi:MAG: hypothetical protein ACRC8A_12405 [Microcoleaceae cyanobacterium]